MPTYTQTIGGKTYTFDSETPLTPDEQRQEATIFYMEDTQAERNNLEAKSKNPTQEENRIQTEFGPKPGSMWQGLEEGASDLGMSLLKPLQQSPMQTGKDLWNAQVREGEKATEARHKGNYLESAGHDILAAIPVVGPMAGNFAEDFGHAISEDDPTRMGKALFEGGVLFGPKAAHSMAKHGGSIAELGRSVAEKHPGIIPALSMAAEEYARTGNAGHAAASGVAAGMGVPWGMSAIRDLLKKSGDESPVAPKPVEGARVVKGSKPGPTVDAAIQEALDEMLHPKQNSSSVPPSSPPGGGFTVPPETPGPGKPVGPRPVKPKGPATSSHGTADQWNGRTYDTSMAGDAQTAAKNAKARAYREHAAKTSAKTTEVTPEQEAAMARDEAALNERLGGEDVPTPGNGTFKPETPAPTSAPRKPFSMRNPNFLKDDVASYKPGSKFNPKDRTLSIPGRVSPQVTKLLRGDESVIGLARELGLNIPEEGLSSYPEPKGPAEAAQALRQRASVAGQRTRTRPLKGKAK
jgi:hypothetical protein